MRSYTRDEVVRALEHVGVVASDVVLVHSSLLTLGRFVGAEPAQAAQAIAGILVDHVGAAGTIVVPAFNFGFARGRAFDRQATPSEGMGNLAEAIRTWPGAQRSPHPMQSVAAVGRYAADICSRDTSSAFAVDGPFHRMLELDARLLLFGVSLQPASFIHYVEERLEVPYRYWKTFAGAYTDQGRTEERSYRMFARDLACDPRLRLRTLEEALVAEAAMRTSSLGMGSVRSCTFADFHRVATRMMAADPFSILSNSEAVRSHLEGSGRT